MNRVDPLSTEALLEAAPFLAPLAQAGATIPTSFHVLGRRPRVLQEFQGFFASIMREGGVDPGLKQLIAHMVSRSAGCSYCQAHTGHFAHTLAGVELAKIEAVWEFEASPLFSEAERAALRLALAAGYVPNGAADEHFEALRRHYSESEIVEIVCVISMFGWLNRFNDTLANELEEDAVAFAGEHLAHAGWEVGKHALAADEGLSASRSA